MHISRFCLSSVTLKQFLLPTSPDLTKRQEGRKTGVVFSSFSPRKKNFMGAGLLGRQKCPWLLGNKLRQRNETHCFFPGFFVPSSCAGSVRGAETVSGEKRGQHSQTKTFHILFPCCCGPERKDRISSDSHTPISPSQTPKNHFQAFIAHKAGKNNV